MTDKPEDQSRDVLLGRKALSLGWISQEQLRDALAERFRESPDTRSLPPLRDVLVARGYLSKEQLDRLLADPAAPEPAAPPAADPPPAPGESFGKYLLVRELGRGGMGVVYEALDRVLNRPVALKVLNDAFNGTAERRSLQEALFLKEARLAASLPPHPNIVTVHEADIIDSKRYLTMALVKGLPMNAWRDQGVTLRAQIRLLRDIAGAIHHAHAHGVIHCDLKPRNVLVDDRNEPHITDFGLAKSLKPDVAGKAEGSDMILGTPSYMSPEQVEGARTLDARCDVYSLGVILYEILTNRLPFEGKKPLETAFKVMYEPLVSPSKALDGGGARPDSELERICLKALARKPEERYETAAAFAEELSAWMEGIRPDSGVRRSIILLLGAAAVGLIVWRLMPAPKHEPPAVPPAPPAPASPRVVDLLPLIDPSVDRVSGAWTLDGGRLRSDSSLFGKIEIPYLPPDEYDLRIVFVRRVGNGDVNLILSREGRNFMWLMGGWSNSIMGFETIGGKRTNQNPTCTRRPDLLENGKSYECVVKVRRDHVEAVLNGSTVVSWKTDYTDFAIAGEWAIRDARRLGLTTYNSVVEVQQIEIVERAGRGRPAR